MEKIIKENGKVYLVKCDDGYWKHITKYTIGTYTEEKEEKPKKGKGTKKGVDE